MEGIGKTKVRSQEQKQQELKRLKEYVHKMLPNEWDTIDVVAMYDSTLSYVENKEILREHIKPMIKDSIEEQKEKMQADAEKIRDERNRKIESEVEKYNNKEYIDNRTLDEVYSPIIRAVTKLCKGYSHLVFIKGRGGIGKSYNIRKTLIKNKAEFHEVCGDVTEAYLYRLLCENNGKIIWFKDVAKLLSGLRNINLLKAATETDDQRLITQNNYSKQQEDLPARFIFTGRLIFDYNTLTGLHLKEDFEALISRGTPVDYVLSQEDIGKVMKEINTTDWQTEVTNYLIKNYEHDGYTMFNLRTQWKAFQTYRYAQECNLDWKYELKEEMKQNMSKTRSMLYSLIGKKAIRTMELKKLLLRHNIINSLTTAHRKIEEWVQIEELFKLSSEQRNYYVSILQQAEILQDTRLIDTTNQ